MPHISPPHSRDFRPLLSSVPPGRESVVTWRQFRHDGVTRLTNELVEVVLPMIYQSFHE